MRTTPTIMSLVALLALTSCSLFEPSRSGVAPPNPKQVAVGVQSGQIQVAEVTTVAASNGAALWVLDNSAADYKFPDNGIAFDYPAPGAPKICRSTPDPKEAFDLSKCKSIDNGRRFVCPKKPNHVSGACYKYTVRLVRTAPGVEPPPKDPWIMCE
jgi:hypothetical protein